MKPVLENISNHLQHSSFHAYSFHTDAFDFKWHFHPEYELTFIVKGSGYRLVGNSHREFFDNDLLLLGPNLPHTWVGKSQEPELFEAIVIQFSADFISKILSFKETSFLADLFHQAQFGIFFSKIPLDFKESLMHLVKSEGLNSIQQFMSILSKLNECSTSILSSQIYKNEVNEKFEKRINKVCNYLQDHYPEPIKLKEIADLVNMTESNFCKFFKKAMGTTFSNYVNDLRLNEICLRLLHSDKQINEIAFSCGFECLSYFNRVFLKKKGISPSVYRKQQRENKIS